MPDVEEGAPGDLDCGLVAVVALSAVDMLIGIVEWDVEIVV